ncbi:hypothetical protein Afe04nite_18890 [Asanoa ferruginea]|uniref:hypothetical protein n=1 Tax=Asanoa ferruginea TaxID=53367 RepID=UPI00194267B1|nr:hypothetical protein [Asanoa ferruginea]GIF47350.1 hypothetical protein Afe04nite_18890 [Asanoa ferruginea]
MSPLDIGSLPISDTARAGLLAWQSRFDSGFVSPDDEDRFYGDGLRLAAALAIELIASHLVEYQDSRYREGLLLGDGGVIVGGDEIILPAHWQNLDTCADRRRALHAQFDREVAEAHALAGRSLDLVAACTVCDDVLFRIRDDAGYAVVHLTWSAVRERAPDFPSTNLHRDRAELLADLSERHHP